MVTTGKGLMSQAEVIKWTGLGRTKIQELTAQGILPSIRIGRRRLYPSDAIEGWLKSLVEEQMQG